MVQSGDSQIEITYQHEGTAPPLFVAGSFTDPAWQPIELEYKTENGQLRFFKTFNVAPGTYQYKLRLGLGDWWICDDSNATEVDGSGNFNNVLVVKPQELARTIDTPAENQTSDATPKQAQSPILASTSTGSKSPPLGVYSVDDSSEDGNQISTVDTTPASEIEQADFSDTNEFSKPEVSTSVVEPKTETANDQNEVEDTSGSAQDDKSLSPLDVTAASSDEAAGTDGVEVSTKDGEPITADDTPVGSQSNEQGSPQKSSSHSTSVSPGKGDRFEPWLTRFCRTVFGSIYGSISSLLNGGNRKNVALALTVVMIPLLAWTLRP